MPLDHERPASETCELSEVVEMLYSTCPENPHCRIRGKDYKPGICKERVCPRRDSNISPWAFKTKRDEEQA